MNNIDVIIENLNHLKEQYEQYGKDEEEIWWENEYGQSLVYGIDCHPVFADSTPCLNDVRKAEYNSIEYHDNCEECKARWLMEVFE